MNAGRKLWVALCALVVLALGPFGAAWAQVKVTAADPASTTQGTTGLDVTISGSGFDTSAAVKFLVAGTTNSDQIEVTSVVVVSSRKLIARINARDSATVALYDIEVALSSGRKGKGTTLFSILSKNTDPCAQAALDFPAFAYWRPSGASRELLLADSTGTCSRSVMTSVGANGAAFSYPIAGNENVGRIVYSDGGTVNAMDITVNHADNTIVLGSPVPLFDSLNVADHELSPDGATVYFGKSADSPENFAGLYRHAIGDTQPPQQIYRGMTPGAGLYTASVSADGFTLVVEEVASFPERHRLLRIALPCSDSAACTTILDETSSSAWPAVHPFNSLVAYSDYLVGFNNCLQLRFLDSTTGAATFAGTQPRYGTASSWFGNQILVNGRKPPDRKGACRESGVVTLVDPATGAETPLVSGYGPDGR